MEVSSELIKKALLIDIVNGRINDVLELLRICFEMIKKIY